MSGSKLVHAKGDVQDKFKHRGDSSVLDEPLAPGELRTEKVPLGSYKSAKESAEQAARAAMSAEHAKLAGKVCACACACASAGACALSICMHISSPRGRAHVPLSTCMHFGSPRGRARRLPRLAGNRTGWILWRAVRRGTLISTFMPSTSHRSLCTYPISLYP